MTFFEFSFRNKVFKEDVLPLIEKLYPEFSLIFYAHIQFYNEELKCPEVAGCFVYEFLYSDAGFRTLFKGEIYNEDPIVELDLALFFAKKLETEIVIADFTMQYPFLLIMADGTIYRADSVGIGDGPDCSDVFEIDYNSLSPAFDLGGGSGAVSK